MSSSTSTSTSATTVHTLSNGVSVDQTTRSYASNGQFEASNDRLQNQNQDQDSSKQQQVNQRNNSGSGLSLPPIGSILKNIESYQNQQQLHDSQLLLDFNQRNNSETHLQSPPLQEQQQGPTQQQPPQPQPQPQHVQQPVHHHELPQANFTFHSPQQRSESTNSIDHFQSEYIKEEQQKIPTAAQIHHHHHHHHHHQQPPFPLAKSQSQPVVQQIPQRVPLPARKSSSFTKTLSSERDPHPHLTVSTSTISEPDDTYGSFTQESRENSVDSALDSPGSLTPNGSNKKRTNLPRETIDILNEWILNNMDNPYPNHTQKKYLLAKTGLSNVQLSNWFINKRRRRLFSNLSGNNGQPIKKKRLIDRL